MPLILSFVTLFERENSFQKECIYTNKIPYTLIYISGLLAYKNPDSVPYGLGRENSVQIEI